ncbi:MAG: YmfQ family protein [Eubacterium sp.]|nr:YmfQ family protein [Eubacterium sp.]
MNSEIYLRLEKLMKKLGFSVSDGSFTKAEMKAYAAAIDLAEAKMSEVLKNIFISTAEGLGLSMFLSMIGERPASDDAQSREMIISAVSDRRGLYTKSYFDSIIKTLGKDSSYTISGNTMIFLYKGNLYRPRFDEYSKLITAYNPCTVVVCNKSGYTCSQWEEAAFRWYETDSRSIPFITLDNIS